MKLKQVFEASTGSDAHSKGDWLFHTHAHAANTVQRLKQQGHDAKVEKGADGIRVRTDGKKHGKGHMSAYYHPDDEKGGAYKPHWV